MSYGLRGSDGLGMASQGSWKGDCGRSRQGMMILLGVESALMVEKVARIYVRNVARNCVVWKTD